MLDFSLFTAVDVNLVGHLHEECNVDLEGTSFYYIGKIALAIDASFAKSSSKSLALAG